MTKIREMINMEPLNMKGDYKDVEEMSEEELHALMERIAKIPPITGSMIHEYTALLNQEMKALKMVWEEYGNPKNAFIANHMKHICDMYEQLSQMDAFHDSKLFGEARGDV